jgi:hypothetical protein
LSAKLFLKNSMAFPALSSDIRFIRFEVWSRAAVGVVHAPAFP